MRLEDLKGRATISIPEAGELLGLHRSHSYEAAKRGQIPTLSFGNRRRVPVAQLLRLLGNEEGTPEEVPSPAQTSTPAPQPSPLPNGRKEDGSQDSAHRSVKPSISN